MAKLKLSPIVTAISGSVKGATFCNTASGQVLKSKQIFGRNKGYADDRIRQANLQVVQAWSTLTAQEKHSWELAAAYHKTPQSKNKDIALSGYQLYLKFN